MFWYRGVIFSSTNGEQGEFDAVYVGSVSVKDPTGNDVCSDAITRIKVERSPLLLLTDCRHSSCRSETCTLLLQRQEFALSIAHKMYAPLLLPFSCFIDCDCLHKNMRH